MDYDFVFIICKKSSCNSAYTKNVQVICFILGNYRYFEEIILYSCIYKIYRSISRKMKMAYMSFLHFENFIAVHTVIQELQIVCDDKKSAPADEMSHSGSLKIRGGTPAQEMGLGKGVFLKV